MTPRETNHPKPEERAVNKLRLDLHELRIDSFPTHASGREGGTAANAITQGAKTCYDCTRFGCPGTALC
jgi:hypothetical protein